MKGDRNVASGNRGQAKEALKIYAMLLEQKLWARKAIRLRNEQDCTCNLTKHLRLQCVPFVKETERRAKQGCGLRTKLEYPCLLQRWVQ